MPPRAVSSLDLGDIQSFVRSGFGSLPFANYWMLDIVDRALALRWLESMRHRFSSVLSVGRNAPVGDGDDRGRHAEAWAIAFSYRGLRALGVRERSDTPFPSTFRMGQSSTVRRRLLRDDPGEPWDWGDADAAAGGRAATEAVSILLIRMGETPDLPAEMGPAAVAEAGLRLVQRIDGDADSFSTEEVNGERVVRLHEPFGFRDAISQPALPDLVATDAAADRRVDDDVRALPLGEIVLGHRNLYGEVAYCPGLVGDADDVSFARNGCYLAARQIAQFVDVFDAFERSHAALDLPSASIGEKLLGRRKDGTPLQTCPHAPAGEDDFGFLVNDPEGFDCPPGAHVRRANPRDAGATSVEAGLASTRLHSLLRRGRPYAATAPRRDEPERQGKNVDARAAPGMFFVALVADLVRQYEFVQRQWLANSAFGGQHAARDPVLGTAGGFGLPAQPFGRRLDALPRFTQTLGGGYFFLPGLAALERLAAGRYDDVSADLP